MKRMLLGVLLLVLTLSLVLSACTRKVEEPGPADPPRHPVPEPRSVALDEVTYGEVKLQRIFSDFAGVSDYALVSGGLLYVYGDTLWSTRFDSWHTAVETHLAPDRDKWHKDLSESHRRLREQSDTLPQFLSGVAVSQGRYLDAEYLLAFSGQNDRRALFLTEPGGQMRAVLRDAEELTLLGWADRASLVFFADLPELGPNIYVLDTWHDFVVPMRAAHQDTLNLPRPIVTDTFVGATGLMWRYDGTSVAYTVGNRVYAIDGAASQRQVYLGNAPVVWAKGNIMITADLAQSVLPELRYGTRQLTLYPLHQPITVVVDESKQALYYVFVDGLETGLAQVNLRDMSQTELFYSAEGHYLSALTLSPDASELLFVQAVTLDVEDGPYDEYRNEVFRYDLISGNMQQLTGFGLDDEVSFSLIAAAHWTKPEQLLLGWKFSGSPDGEKWLNSYTISAAGEVLSVENWHLHLQVSDAESGLMFLNNYSSSEGYWDFMDMDLWYYDKGLDEDPVRITERQEWEVDKNRALAYNPAEGWLFVLREKGWLEPDWTGQIFHGLVLDLHGNEYTVLKEGLDGSEKAVWVGNNLYIQKRDRIIRLAFP